MSLGQKWEQKLTTQDTREWGRGIETSLAKNFALKEKERGEEGIARGGREVKDLKIKLCG